MGLRRGTFAALTMGEDNDQPKYHPKVKTPHFHLYLKLAEYTNKNDRRES